MITSPNFVLFVSFVVITSPQQIKSTYFEKPSSRRAFSKKL